MARDVAGPVAPYAKQKQEMAALALLADDASFELQGLRLENAALQQRSRILEQYAAGMMWQLEVLRGQGRVDVGAIYSSRLGIEALPQPCTLLALARFALDG